MTMLPPRPMLARANWIDLCGPWPFAVDDDERGIAEGWFSASTSFDQEIVVPFPPESKLSQVHDTGHHPVVWYRRTVDVEATGDRRCILHFGAVDYDARVWVNDQMVAAHQGGHAPFEVDITDQLRPGAAHVIAVRAEDRMDGLDQPRGKQDWQLEPLSIWYHRTTGIWQPVWIDIVDPVHVVDIRWTPDLAAAAVQIEVMLSRKPDRATHLDIGLDLNDAPLAAQRVCCDDQRIQTTMAIPLARNDQALDRLLWRPESPTLIQASLLLAVDGVPGDRMNSYFGFRSVGVDRGQFLPNGRPYRLRMVLEQGYWPHSLLAAPSPEAHREEVAQIKQLGFNGARLHQKIEDPRFLYWCDRLGLTVWAEMPSAYSFSARAVARTTDEWIAVIGRDRSHPCVVAWVPMNESWGTRWIADRADQQSFVTALSHLTKALDPTRPVVSNDGWEHTTSDLLTVHDYSRTGDELTQRYGTTGRLTATIDGWGAAGHRVLLAPTTGSQTAAGADRRPVLLTEFGGIGLTSSVDGAHPSDGTQMMYSRADTADDFLRRLSSLVSAIDGSDQPAGFCYTQLTDTEQETNGLLTADRLPKAPVDQIRAIITGQPRMEQQ